MFGSAAADLRRDLRVERKQPPDDIGGSLHAVSSEPRDLESWREFHQTVGALSQDEQEVVNLIFYEGPSQEEAAKLLARRKAGTGIASHCITMEG